MIVAIGACFSYIVWLVTLRPEPRTIPVTVPIAIAIPVVTPAPPAPIVEEVGEQIERPRSDRLMTPNLPLSCAIREHVVDIHDNCILDAGLPAISDDGATIGVLVSEGEHSLKFRFIAVATSKLVDEVVIFTERDGLDAKTFEPSKAARAVMLQRATEIQKKLDAGRYRSLLSLPQAELGSERIPGLSMVYDRNEDENDVSVIDEDAELVLWKDRFVATERGYPARVLDEDSGPDCYPAKTSSIATWWDARTRTILAQVDYMGWACDCPTWAVQHYVRHAATP